MYKDVRTILSDLNKVHMLKESYERREDDMEMSSEDGMETSPEDDVETSPEDDVEMSFMGDMTHGDDRYSNDELADGMNGMAPVQLHPYEDELDIHDELEQQFGDHNHLDEKEENTDHDYGESPKYHEIEFDTKALDHKGPPSSGNFKRTGNYGNNAMVEDNVSVVSESLRPFVMKLGNSDLNMERAYLVTRVMREDINDLSLDEHKILSEMFVELVLSNDRSALDSLVTAIREENMINEIMDLKELKSNE